MSNPAIQLLCTNSHLMDRGADWCSTCGEPPAKPIRTQDSVERDDAMAPRGEETK